MAGRIGAGAVIASLGGVLLASAWGHGGTDLVVWNWCLAALGGVGLAYLAVAGRRGYAPPLNRITGICIALLFAYVLFQLLPLPLAILNALSPKRAELTRAL